MDKIERVERTTGYKDFQGKVDITDPCHEKHQTGLRKNDVQIRPGTYRCYVIKEEGTWVVGGKECPYNRTAAIGIVAEGVEIEKSKQEWFTSIDVDAGMAGFFHDKPDYTDEEWKALCEMTRTQEGPWLTDDGFFSFSGDGDGTYSVMAQTENGEIVALEIEFPEQEW